MASITVEAQQTAIQAILETVSGIETVLTDLPEAIKPGDLPMLILWPKDGQYNRREDGANGYRVRRRWSLLLIVLEAAHGREYHSDNAVKPFLTTVPDKLAVYPLVKLADGRTFNLDLHQGSDRGADPLVYKKKSYAATAFTFYTVTLTRIQPVR